MSRGGSVDHLDFELSVGEGEGLEYRVEVLRSPAGEAQERMTFPFSELDLRDRLKSLEIALLRSSSARRRRVESNSEREVREFGAKLFDALMVGEVRNRFDVSKYEARQKGMGLRIKLRFEAPELASLPWEFLFDHRADEYLCLSSDTPLVRYLELSQPVEALTVTPPLRVLGLICSPSTLDQLDVEKERMRIEEAIRPLEDRGLVELVWLEGTTWRHLQRALRRGGDWHVFHFVGHGGFDTVTGEGLIMLTDEDGDAHRLPARDLGRLLGDHHALRLAVLNSCEGARADKRDIFSSTAATLVRRGTPAVVAMQYEISDGAAVELARSFYEAVADGLPVDCALTEARKSVTFALSNTVEWGTPVLYMRAPNGVLFDLKPGDAVPAAKPPSTPPDRQAVIDLADERPSVPRAAEPVRQPARATVGAPQEQKMATSAEPERTERRAARPVAFCRKCGATRATTGRFCNKCGASFG